MRVALIYFIVFVFLFAACEQGNPSDQVTAKASLGGVKRTAQLVKEISKENLAFIYDYDKERKRLDYRAVKVDWVVDNGVQDAVNAFLQFNHFRGEFKHLKVDSMTQSDEQYTLQIKGQPQYASQDDSLLFHKALEMTVARYLPNTSYQILFIE